MATQSAATTATGSPASVKDATRLRGYFFWSSLLLLALVLTGFAPTLYARPLFTQVQPNMPWYLYVHGAVLTGWFAWFAVQTWLVRSRNTALHRKTGWVGVAFAAGVCVVGPLADLRAIARAKALGIDFGTDVFWGNLLGIVTFGVLVTAAILLRTRTEFHRRLMLIATIAIIPPALARLSLWPILGGEGGPFVPVVFLGLLLSVVAYDLLTRRKPHPATLYGVAAVFAAALGSSALAFSEFGQAFVRSLG